MTSRFRIYLYERSLHDKKKVISDAAFHGTIYMYYPLYNVVF